MTRRPQAQPLQAHHSHIWPLRYLLALLPFLLASSAARSRRRDARE